MAFQRACAGRNEGMFQRRAYGAIMLFCFGSDMTLIKETVNLNVSEGTVAIVAMAMC